MRSWNPSGPGSGAGARPEPDTAAVDAALTRRMIEIRRHLHRNPELSNTERETQAYLKQVLEEAGLGPVRTVAGFGLALDIVGTAGPSNRKVVIRADIDALPIEEMSGEPFTSEKPGVMHACGHDAHTAILLGVADSLVALRDKLPGEGMLIFQPAAERAPPPEQRGADLWLKEGRLQPLKPESVICLHGILR